MEQRDVWLRTKRSRRLRSRLVTGARLPAGGLAPGRARDGRDHNEFGDRRPGNKHSLGVGADVGRNQEDPRAVEQGKVVRGQALNGVAVGQPQPQPESLAPGTSRVTLAQQALRVVDFAGVEVADVAQPFDLLQRAAVATLPARSSSSIRAVADKMGRRQVAGQPLAG